MSDKIQTGRDCPYCNGVGFTHVNSDPCEDCPQSGGIDEEDECNWCDIPPYVELECLYCLGSGKELMTVVQYLKYLKVDNETNKWKNKHFVKKISV